MAPWTYPLSRGQDVRSGRHRQTLPGLPTPPMRRREGGRQVSLTAPALLFPLHTDVLGHHLHGSESPALSTCPLTPRPAQLPPGCGSCPTRIWAAPGPSLQGPHPPPIASSPSVPAARRARLSQGPPAPLWQGRPRAAGAALAFQRRSLALLPGADCWRRYSSALRPARHGPSQLCPTNKRIWPR